MASRYPDLTISSSFDKRNIDSIMSAPLPIGIPFMDEQQTNGKIKSAANPLDADTVAYATAAAAAAYHDAIAARTGVSATETPPRLRTFNAPPTPTSPTRSSIMSPYSDTPVSPFYNGEGGFPMSASPNSGRKTGPQRTPQRNDHRRRTQSNGINRKPESVDGSPEDHQLTGKDAVLGSATVATPTSVSPCDDGSEKSKPERDSKKMNLYKTELCRSWEETGTCRYGNKCQFAHSVGEVRNVDRHPKYKTEMCKTFWEKGTCPYGKRCCFIHTERNKMTGKPSPSSASEERVPMSPIQITPPRARSNSSATRSGDELSESPRRNGKPLGIFTDRSILGMAAGAATAPAIVNNKEMKSLFDAVPSHDFSLWSPTVGSPERSVFSFDQRAINESMMRQNFNSAGPTPSTPFPRGLPPQQMMEENLSQVEHALQSFQINSPLDVAAAPNNPLALLSPISTRFNNDFRSDMMHQNFTRSAMSAGIPSSSPAFFGSAPIPESSFEDELPIERFRRSRAPTGTMSVNVPILATPPRANGPASAYAKNRSDSFGSSFNPLAGHFSPLLDSTTLSLGEQGPLSAPHHQRTLSNGVSSAATFAQVVYPAKSHPSSGATGKLEEMSGGEMNGMGQAPGPVGRHGSLRKFDSGVSFYDGPNSPRPL